DEPGHAGLALRKLTPLAARYQSRLSRVIEPLPITEGGAKLMVGLDAPRQPADGVPWLQVTLDGAPAAIQIPFGIARRLIDLPAEGAEPEDSALLLEAALTPWLDELEAALGLTFRFVALAPTVAAFGIETTVEIRGKDAAGSFVQMRQSVRLSEPAAEALANALEPRKTRRADLPGLLLSIDWDIGGITLDAATLRSLVPGDAIEIGREETGRAVLEHCLVAPATRNAGHIHVRGPFIPSLKESAMSDDVEVRLSPEPTEVLPEADLNEIEVRLSFRMGGTALPLRTLREMAPGAIIETTDEANAVVDILANGRTVGTGEVIEVAGRRAVQIRRLFTGQ
ncbi:MAG: FliM/FliN family flagellar motor switch protein, partial [Pseudomonadota bacterium]